MPQEDFGKDFFAQAYEESIQPAEQTGTDATDEKVDETQEQKDADMIKAQVEGETEPKGDDKDEETETSTEKETAPQTFKIGDKEYTAEQIAELEAGNLRQSDYTKKTQELAEMRKKLEAGETIEPEAKEEVKEDKTDASKDDKYNKLEREILGLKMDLEVKELVAKYPDFDKTKVLAKANELGITDLESAYKAVTELPDVEKIKTDAYNQAKADLLKEMQANTDATSETIVTTAKEEQVTSPTDSLSKKQLDIAKAFGMTPEEYLANM